MEYGVIISFISGAAIAGVGAYLVTKYKYESIITEEAEKNAQFMKEMQDKLKEMEANLKGNTSDEEKTVTDDSQFVDKSSIDNLFDENAAVKEKDYINYNDLVAELTASVEKGEPVSEDIGPVLIFEEEFGADSSYDIKTITYYDVDGVFINDDGECEVNGLAYVGADNLSLVDDDIFYIRNDMYGVYVEVNVVHGSGKEILSTY